MNTDTERIEDMEPDSGLMILAASESEAVSVLVAGKQVAVIREAVGAPMNGWFVEVSEPGTYVVIKVEV
jgi:hypothetical protein